MKSTGVVRRIDDVGRVVIPKEFRNTLGMEEGTYIEFFPDCKKGVMVLRPYVTGCVFCREATEDAFYMLGKKVCQKCWKTMELMKKSESKKYPKNQF